MKLPPHNHRALKVFESTKVSPQCFYFLQVFHSSKQQKIGLSDLHGVPCTNLGRDFFLEGLFFCCAQRLVVFEVSEPLSEADKPCASILSEIRAFEPSETLRRRCSGLARQKDTKLYGATLTKCLHTYQFTVLKHTPLFHLRQKVKRAVRQLSCQHHCYVKHDATTKGMSHLAMSSPIWPCQNAVPLVCPFWAFRHKAFPCGATRNRMELNDCNAA